MQVTPPGDEPKTATEALGLLGDRRVGEVRILENNPVRIRLASTWYFPAIKGERISPGVRQLGWEYTIYGDGRMVTHVELNNSGGPQIGLKILQPEVCAWAGGKMGREMFIKAMEGPLGRWSCMSCPQGLLCKQTLDNYVAPPMIEHVWTDRTQFAPGDLDKDDFDESQGCFFLQAKNKRCRFIINPPPDGAVNPVFRIQGLGGGKVSASAQGLAIRDIAVLEDGSVLFMLKGVITRPTTIEAGMER